MKKAINPSRIVIFGFAAIILLGTVLLAEPFSAKGEHTIDLIDALFTATSATCVTGLTVLDTGSFFSPIGKTVILFLIQTGGLGIMTISTLFMIMLGRKLTIKDNIMITSALDRNSMNGIKQLLKYIILITLGIELCGAVILGIRWYLTQTWAFKELVFNALFHSVAAFCNAGIALFSDNLCGFKGDTTVNLTIMGLIIAGGLGFTVLIELPRIIRSGSIKRFSVQTKLTLLISFVLIFAGAIFVFFVEKGNVLKGFTLKESILASFFQSVTTRTAGFNTLDIGALLTPTLFFMILLMFIGASPGSTGGGIKTTTFGILLATCGAMMFNKDKVSIFKRSIPKEIIRRSIVLLFLSVFWCLFATMILCFSERKILDTYSTGFLRIFFEVVSAFGTVGLSTGITTELSTLGKTVIILTMFLGRTGPLTVALSVAMVKDERLFSYPEERVMVG